ncbi:MAG TPA: TIGR01459 family HAD-type hydrolase [Roseiarcus sp.]|nr:TIGR01459 family HAD-type hydrolase [Roseiarcus sp.]
MTASSRFLSIAAKFDGVFMDQYGVLHDGSRLYPGAEEALRGLRALSVKVAILSNSGRSGQENARRMAKLGLRLDLYDRFVTSGDAAEALLKSKNSPAPLAASTRCLALSSDGGPDFAQALGLRSAPDGAEADLVVISGSQGDRFSLDHYRRILAPAAARKVPCLCANPDRLMLTGAGVAFGAGRIAELYEELGGSVIWIGKPYLPIYQAAAAQIGIADPARLLCVGDSVEHDVVGAHRFGAAALLVRTGILAQLDERELAAEFEKHRAIPEYIIPDLR